MLALGAFVLCTLAAARVTRIIVDDKISIPFRRWVVKRNGEEGWWTKLVHCPYCVSVWISVPAAAYWMAMVQLPSWTWLWFPPAIFAMAYLVAPVLQILDRGE